MSEDTLHYLTCRFRTVESWHADVGNDNSGVSSSRGETTRVRHCFADDLAPACRLAQGVDDVCSAEAHHYQDEGATKPQDLPA